MFLSSSAVSSLIGFFLTAASSAFAFKCADIFLNRNKGRKQNAKTFSLKTAFCFSLLVGILCPLFAYFAEQNPYQHSILIFPILIFYLISVSAIDIKTHIIPDIFPLSAA
ncbi:MAG: hypothetical protein LBH29_06845, partial [Elusimicrobiota bacterium]|nr:hypothetical protein [Elusimicrobiota bacterium]